MIQTWLVIVAVLLSTFWLGRKIWLEYFSGKNKCEGCAVHKIYAAKLEMQAKKK
jgi:hypothetical protein